MNILLATQNPHKIAELRAVLPEGWSVQVPSDFGIVGDLAEDGSRLEENAAQKARFLWERTGMPSLADDSGLEVDALFGEPGVASAQYAGPQRSDADNRRKLLDALGSSLNRTARFRTVLAWATETGVVLAAGEVRGRIALAEKGTQGFGYDSLFVPDEGDGRSFAEMSLSEKSALSHRSRAVATWLALLQKS